MKQRKEPKTAPQAVHSTAFLLMNFEKAVKKIKLKSGRKSPMQSAVFIAIPLTHHIDRYRQLVLYEID